MRMLKFSQLSIGIEIQTQFFPSCLQVQGLFRIPQSESWMEELLGPPGPHLSSVFYKGKNSPEREENLPKATQQAQDRDGVSTQVSDTQCRILSMVPHQRSWERREGNSLDLSPYSSVSCSCIRVFLLFSALVVSKPV